jgi:hypothetical protein
LYLPPTHGTADFAGIRRKPTRLAQASPDMMERWCVAPSAQRATPIFWELIDARAP